MMGREESLEKLTGAHIIYSCMQVADIFMLKAHITQLGMDQRKVNMLAREVGPLLGYWKPIVVSHHMLMGLGKPENLVGTGRNLSLHEDRIKQVIALKMSKSKPDTAIFMTDTTEDIRRKINKAYCLEGDVKENPILEYCKYIIFESFDRLSISEFVVERPEKWGGTLRFKTYAELEGAFAQKLLHPQDLKVTVVKLLDQLLQPVRNHFEENMQAKQLLETVKSYQVTR